ncbi:MAG: UDP-N-acetylglucosamine 4,6-dehydratase (inverting) [Negativicutes bacterium]|nr:UDP-N-acetylglucosamine 4,6-dehydratase (inverting) [Negativicutes bacterium]
MFEGKSILITGGTGSFGQKFTEMVLANYRPARVIVFSRDEFKQYQMKQRFSEDRFPSIRYFLGDVRDRDRINRALHGVNYVVHAAALKHVSAAEYNPFEFVRTNVIGTQNVIDAAVDRGVERLVFLSTDKAVNPVNLYGATKMCAEKITVAANSYSGGRTRCSVVRYGNVVGSRGSVVPLFLQQAKTGDLPITDQRMTRFWITLEQGVKLVWFAMVNAQGGEIFVPKLPMMRVVDLAEAVDPGGRRRFTGIRPGEKIHELMISADEARHAVDIGDKYVIEPETPFWHYRPWQGQRLPEGFFYSSEDDSWQLTTEQLRQYLATLEVEN